MHDMNKCIIHLGSILRTILTKKTVPGMSFGWWHWTHMLPQYCTTYIDVFLMITCTKMLFSESHFQLPENGPGGTKYLGATVA
jgi:hypothetical protein